MEVYPLTKAKRRLRNSLRKAPVWKLIYTKITRCVTTVFGKKRLLQVQIFGKNYISLDATFRQAALNFLGEFYLDYYRYALYQGSKMVPGNQSAIACQMIDIAEGYGALSHNQNANYTLTTLAPCVDDPRVEELVQETVDEHGFSEIYETYVRSDKVEETERHAKGFLVHFSEDGQKPDYVSTKDMIITLFDLWLHETPLEDSKGQVADMDVMSLARIGVGDTSAGNFTAEPVKKKAISVEVAGVVARQAQTGQAKTAPAKPSQKQEAFPNLDSKGDLKKVRAIQSDDAALSLAGEACVGSWLRCNPGLEGGSAIGVSTNGAYGMRLMRQLTRPFGLGHEASIKEAERRGLHVSDIKGFEAVMKMYSAVLYVVMCITAVTSLAQAGAVASNFFAHYAHPFFSIAGDKMCSKEGVVCSGSKPTANGNTKRHSMLLLGFKQFVQSHGMRMGEKGCMCGKCDKLEHLPDFGKKVDPLELALLMSAVLMGDDFICIWNDCSAFYDQFSDLIFGTVHKTDWKPLYEGLFLKRRFKRLVNSDGTPGWITTEVAPQEAIPKFKGPRGMEASRKMSSCISYAVNCNNRQVYDFCYDLYHKLEAEYGRALEVDDILMEQFKGTYEFDGFPSWEFCVAQHVPLNPKELSLSQANWQSVRDFNLPLSMTVK